MILDWKGERLMAKHLSIDGTEDDDGVLSIDVSEDFVLECSDEFISFVKTGNNDLTAFEESIHFDQVDTVEFLKRLISASEVLIKELSYD